MLILYNVRMDMAGGVDFSAANAKSNAQLRVKGLRTFHFDLFIYLNWRTVCFVWILFPHSRASFRNILKCIFFFASFRSVFSESLHVKRNKSRQEINKCHIWGIKLILLINNFINIYRNNKQVKAETDRKKKKSETDQRLKEKKWIQKGDFT